MIDPQTAIVAARRGLEQTRHDPAQAAALARCAAGSPLLVKRLDLQGQGYYLIPWQDRSGIWFMVQVDAASGAMSSLAALPAPASGIGISQADARRAAEQLQLKVVGEPELVWQPCRETSSPFAPLYRVPVENGTVFVGIDLAVHRKLTPFDKGG